MEPTDCGRCDQTTSEYLELGETAYCGTCIKDVLEPLRCCLCDGKIDVWIDLPSRKHPNVYCHLCLNELEKARMAELDRIDIDYILPKDVEEEEASDPKNKKQKK